MDELQGSDALPVIVSALDETHDGLAGFSQKLGELNDVPTFWYHDFPVWVETCNAEIEPWPLICDQSGAVGLSCPSGVVFFRLKRSVLRVFFDDALSAKLSDAEFALLVDLSSGLSLQDAADAADVAVSTRRKQLQTLFRKLSVSSQSELVAFGSVLSQRFSAVLADLYGTSDSSWGEYSKYIPKGVRFGVIEDAEALPVRYLEFGPVTGQVVMVLHPMVFPDLCDKDVRLVHELGCRLIWPIRPSCLSQRALGASSWAAHCDTVVEDCKRVHGAFTDAPIPVIALVSSGSYATRFAQKYPQCVSRISFLATCYSAGKKPTRDAYFGEFLVRGLRENKKLAMALVQHLSGAAFSLRKLEQTMRKIFGDSQPDRDILDQVFTDKQSAERLQFAIRHSIGSMRLDYLSQLNFKWDEAARLEQPAAFWHGAQDAVHELEDLARLSLDVSQAQVNVLPKVGHLTEGASLRCALSSILRTYSK